MNVAIGLLTGSLTSTPGLAAAIETTQSSMASIGYGIAYPFGVIGVILFVRLFPKFMRIDVDQEAKKIEEETQQNFPELFNKNFVVENEYIVGKSIRDLKIRSMTQANIPELCIMGRVLCLYLLLFWRKVIS
jgi:putative transport protein